jgi:adenosylcobyric acid synthase
METTMQTSKQLLQVSGRLAFADAQFSGYEIHMGISSGVALDQPALLLSDGAGSAVVPEGALSTDGQVAGTYVHGLFDYAESCAAWLAWAGLNDNEATHFNYEALREAELERLADCIEQHLDLRWLD